LKLRRK